MARWSEDAPAAGRTTTEEGGGNPTTLRDLVLLRTLLETRGSFRDLDTWSRVDGKDGRLGRNACPRLLGTWAACEREVTRDVLQLGSVFRLAADGLGRTYQVELGAVLWTLPARLQWLLQLQPGMRDVSQPTVQQLGPKGPWLVDRLLSARDLPDDMDTAGKADGVWGSVRRALLGPDGGG